MQEKNARESGFNLFFIYFFLDFGQLPVLSSDLKSVRRLWPSRQWAMPVVSGMLAQGVFRQQSLSQIIVSRIGEECLKQFKAGTAQYT